MKNQKPVFSNCNVCGRGLARKDELVVGMCAICANEEIPDEPCKEPSTIDIGRMQYLERIAETADALERWLGQNTGTNDDWPIQIKADEEGGQKMTALLTDLKEALSPYRHPMTALNTMKNKKHGFYRKKHSAEGNIL